MHMQIHHHVERINKIFMNYIKAVESGWRTSYGKTTFERYLEYHNLDGEMMVNH